MSKDKIRKYEMIELENIKAYNKEISMTMQWQLKCDPWKNDYILNDSPIIGTKWLVNYTMSAVLFWIGNK